MKTVLLMIISIASGVLGNVSRKAFSGNLKTTSDNLTFSLIGNALCIPIMLCLGGSVRSHPYTLLLAFLFGTLNMLTGLFLNRALQIGPVSITSLFQSGGNLILSALLGTVLWKEAITGKRILGILLMLLSITMITEPKAEKKGSVRWISLVLLSAASNSLLGIIQKLQNSSPYVDESTGFLFWLAVFGTAVNLLWLLLQFNTGKKEPITVSPRTILLPAVLCGFTMAAIDIANLKMAGLLPAAVLFPINSGGWILFTALAGIIVFHEKLSKKQLLSFIPGIAAIILIAA